MTNQKRPICGMALDDPLLCLGRELCLVRSAIADQKMPCKGCPGIVPLFTPKLQNFTKRKPTGKSVCENPEMIAFVSRLFYKGWLLSEIAKETGYSLRTICNVAKNIPEYVPKKRLTFDEKTSIRAHLLEGKLTHKQIAAIYGVSFSPISKMSVKMKREGL